MNMTIRSCIVGVLGCVVALVLTVASVVMSAPPAYAATQTIVLDGVTYTFDDANPPAGATVTSYDSAAGSDVVIEGSVSDGDTAYPVTAIGDGAFFRMGLTSVTIPDSVTTIGGGAFLENFLSTVTIPDSVTSIGNAAFIRNELTNLTIPDSVTTIGMEAFFENNLATVAISDSVTSIGQAAFLGNSLTSVTIPDSVTSIGQEAFYANSLTSVTIRGSGTIVGISAFGANPLDTVNFEGDAPVVESPDTGRAFGDPGQVVLLYPRDADGFTTPTWMGYSAYPSTNDVTFDSGDGVVSVEVDYGGVVDPP
ncbi:MAG: leucine-rich repeat domain-containing protein, partial [Pseudoclavibacter sp.]